jgi:hypothetical protein
MHQRWPVQGEKSRIHFPEFVAGRFTPRQPYRGGSAFNIQGQSNNTRAANKRQDTFL